MPRIPQALSQNHMCVSMCMKYWVMHLIESQIQDYRGFLGRNVLVFWSKKVFTLKWSQANLSPSTDLVHWLPAERQIVCLQSLSSHFLHMENVNVRKWRGESGDKLTFLSKAKLNPPPCAWEMLYIPFESGIFPLPYCLLAQE